MNSTVQPDYTKPAFDALHRSINETVLPLAIYGALAIVAVAVFERWLVKKLKQRKRARSNFGRRR
jgi:hypothetical protein